MLKCLLFICMLSGSLMAGFPALAQAPAEGLEVRQVQRFQLADDPFSGPVEALINSEHATIPRGGVMDVFLVVQNHSNEATVSVVIDLELRYADDVRVQPFHLGAERAQTLGPDEGVGFLIFWLIPADAPLGTGTFTVNARVGQVTGDDNHATNENPMVASDSVTFEVVP